MTRGKEIYLTYLVLVIATIAIVFLALGGDGFSGFASKKVQSLPGPVVLKGPTDGATDIHENQKFKWNATTLGTQFFIFYIDDEPGFSSPIVSEFQLKKGKRQFVIPKGTLSPGTKYYWRVVAYNQLGATNSQVRSFTTVNVAQPVPTVIDVPVVTNDPVVATNSETTTSDYGTQNTEPIVSTVSSNSEESTYIQNEPTVAEAVRESQESTTETIVE